MSKREIVASIFDHNEWANLKVLEAASLLSEDELTENRGPDCGSLYDVLSHMLASHFFMLTLSGVQPPPLESPQPGRLMATIRESFDKVHPLLQELATSFNDEQLDDIVTFDNPDLEGRWRKWQRPRWNVLMSTGTHAMQHRGEERSS